MMEINFDNRNDKVANYWRSSYKTQMNDKIPPKNTIKISNTTNHLGLYEIEETTNNNGNIFIKQYKLNSLDLNKYINTRRTNYNIIQGGNNIINKNDNDNVQLNFQKTPSKNAHPEYRHNFTPQESYRQSFNNKHNLNSTNNFTFKDKYNPSLAMMDPSQSYRSSYSYKNSNKEDTLNK